jgi:hypothetical protein
MAAINLKLFDLISSQGLIIVIFFLISCKTSTRVSEWVSWKKDNDSPGLHYRSICLGKNYKGSKFFKWEIEVFNDYHETVSFKVVICDGLNGKEASEIRTMIVPSSTLKKVPFYNNLLNCHQKHDVKFLNVQFIP